jgi:hypothetical protein
MVFGGLKDAKGWSCILRGELGGACMEYDFVGSKCLLEW